jgi:hypothetical protein
MENTIGILFAIVLGIIPIALAIRLMGVRWLLRVFKDIGLMMVLVAVSLAITLSLIFGLTAILPNGYKYFIEDSSNSLLVAAVALILIFVIYFGLAMLLAKLFSRHDGPMREKMIVSRHMYVPGHKKTSKSKKKR